MPFLPKKPQIYNLDEPVLFGKYKGATLREIIEEDAQYVNWMIDNIPHFDISCDALDYLTEWDESDDEYFSNADLLEMAR